MGYCLFLRIVKTCVEAKRATDKAVEVSTNFEWFAKFNRVGFELVDKKKCSGRAQEFRSEDLQALFFMMALSVKG